MEEVMCLMYVIALPSTREYYVRVRIVFNIIKLLDVIPVLQGLLHTQCDTELQAPKEHYKCFVYLLKVP